MEGHFGRSIILIGDRWSFLVLAAAYFQITRFADFQKQLNIATNILSDRLNCLTEIGLLARNRYSKSPPRHEYILTAKSIDFFRLLVMLAVWGDRWLTRTGGDPFVRKHTLCGKRLKVSVVCENCDTTLQLRDVRFQRRHVATAR